MKLRAISTDRGTSTIDIQQAAQKAVAVWEAGSSQRRSGHCSSEGKLYLPQRNQTSVIQPVSCHFIDCNLSWLKRIDHFCRKSSRENVEHEPAAIVALSGRECAALNTRQITATFPLIKPYEIQIAVT